MRVYGVTAQMAFNMAEKKGAQDNDSTASVHDRIMTFLMNEVVQDYE